LRFEDYIYRLWIQQEGIVAAHVDAAQNHIKSNYMRNPPAAEILNEEEGAKALLLPASEDFPGISGIEILVDCGRNEVRR
jgi:hypothetical protein